MNRFNLTFSGEIVTGHTPEEVKLRFGKMFAIDDPVRLEQFFSGDPVILRRNLERKEAAQYFQDMHNIGAISELVKVTTSDAANATAERPSPPPSPGGKNTRKREKIRPAPSAKKKPKGRSQSKADKALEDAARKKSRKEVAKRHAAEDAVQHQTRLEQATAEKAQRLAEVTARLKAEQAEQQRVEAEEAVGLEAERKERERHEARETARLEAEQKERERLAAQEAIRLEAERKERERLATEEAIRLEAERKERERLATEEAIRLEAERKEREHLKAQEAARLEAKRKEQERLKAEKAARVKAEREEKKRLKAQEAARLKAEQEEDKRRKAEAAARRKAEQEEQARLAAEQAARLQAELEEQQRRDAEEARRLQAELDEIQRQQDQQAAKLQADLAEKERETAAEAVRIAAEADRKKAAAQKKSQQRRRAAALPRSTQQHKQEPLLPHHAPPEQAREEQAVQRAAQEVPKQISLKHTKARVKTNLDVPQRLTGHTAASEIRRKRQPGEPNLYQLQAFRNTPEVRGRAAKAKQRMRKGFMLGALALAGLLLLTGAFLRNPPSLTLAGASAIAIDRQNGPVMLAGDRLLLHDRAGISTGQVTLKELGLASLQGPMAFESSGELIALGQLVGATDGALAIAAPVMLRCNLSQPACLPFSAELADARIGAFAINDIDNTLLLADTAGQQLLKATAQGQVILRKEVAIPEQPTLRLNSGLLFMNSAVGPAISVFRYDDNAFAEQLDEVLLLAPAAIKLEQNSTGDFVWSADAWWANLINPQNGSMGLYRFDPDWNFLDQVDAPFNQGRLTLHSWAMKTLATNGHSVAIQRFNAQGDAEAPLVSPLLQELVAGQQRRANLTALSWRSGLLLCALAAALGMCFGYLQRLRSLVYKSHRERGAQPVDDYEDTLQWIDPVANRKTLLRRRGISYALLVTALLLLAIGYSVSPLQLTALLITLTGPAIALLLWSRRPLGNIGYLDQNLLLVDHNGMYHMGEGSELHYRGPFLIIDDIVVFTGNYLLPAFAPQQIHKAVKPRAAGGIKVDSNTVWVKLLQSQHPIALGAIAMVASATAGALLLGLQGIL